MALAAGEVAPDFTLRATDGSTVTLSELRGHNVVLVFYPFTFTGVCQGEVCELRDNITDFQTADAKLFGVSCDASPSQKQWAQEQGLTFPLLADFWPHGEVAKAYGVFNDTLGCANRGTFVIDKDGVISSVFETANLGTPRAKEEYDAALAKLS
jgi:peroxiredoxin (alkyl hydroperoxide reductase subunit C)